MSSLSVCDSPLPPSPSLVADRHRSPGPDEAESTLGSSYDFLSTAPLLCMRQSSFGVDEPQSVLARDESPMSECDGDGAMAAADEANRRRVDEKDLAWHMEPIMHHINLNEPLLLQSACDADDASQVRREREVESATSVKTKPSSDTKVDNTRNRVFHQFLLQSLTPFLHISEVCTAFIPVCKSWRQSGHRSLADPARRMHPYAAQRGGRPIIEELKRITTQKEGRRRVESNSGATRAIPSTSERVSQLSAVSPTNSDAAPPPKSATSRAPYSRTHDLAPSVTLLQHLQFIPSNAIRDDAPCGGSRPLLARLKRFYRRYLSCPKRTLTNADCLLVSTHLTHLRVLRIFDGSNIGNDGVKVLSLQLRHLRILHMGRLSDLNIDDRALEYVATGLNELHSLWMTQDTSIPVATLWNPRPRIIYNLFTASGVAKLVALHQTLHHINLGGFRNITLTSLRLVSTGTPRLHLHSLHLNGWQITDECISLLHGAHCDTLYHLHLFDVGISNVSLALLSGMRVLETLILDHVQEIDQRGIEAMVDEAARSDTARQMEAIDQEASHTYATPALALHRLELHSCPHLLTHHAILYLALHPTMRELEVSGLLVPVSPFGAHPPPRSGRVDWRLDSSCTRTLAQVEDLTRGRIQCNGGVRRRQAAQIHSSSTHHGSTASAAAGVTLDHRLAALNVAHH